MSLIDENVRKYIQDMLPFFDGKLGLIQKDASENKIPIIPPETARLLAFLVTVSKPKNILEIGCAVGFSASLMAQYMPTDGKVTTIERYPAMIEKAKSNFAFMEAENKVRLLEGDANDILPTLTGSYDMIFLDAAKGQYIHFLPECIRLLQTGGTLIADNVLQKGTLAADMNEIPRRQRTIHKRLRAFLQAISSTKELQSTIIPIGDGLSVSYKLAEKTKGENER